jgi:hypothetical protein
MKKKPQKLLGSLLALTFASGVPAFETGAQLTLAGEFSDNINQSELDPQSDTAVTAAARINISHSGPVLDLSGILLGSYTDYIDDTFEDQWLLNSDIRADWYMSNSLLWRASNQTNQVSLDPLGVNLPDNTENQNLFRTGPEWITTFGPVTRFTLGASYGINTFSISASDNQRINLYTQLRRTVRPNLALSLNARVEETMFDDEIVNLNFDRGDAFFRFEWARAAFSMQGDFGVTRIELDGEAKQDEPLKDIIARYLQSSGGVITLQLRDGVGDSTTGFDDPLFSPGGGSGSSDFSSGGLFRDRRATANWSRRLGRVTGVVNLFYRDRDFFTTDFDQIQYGAAAALNFLLNERWTLGIGANWDHTEFDADGREDEFRSASLRLTRRIGKNLDAFAQVAYLKRESTDILFRFDDVRALIGIQYSIGKQPTITARRTRRSVAPLQK